MAKPTASELDSMDEEMKKMVQETVSKIKSQGVFDQFRKECLADVDTKPAAQNLCQRVEGFVSRFLGQQRWSPALNKNQLRDKLRKQINQSGMLTQGVERIIEQVVNPKIFQVIKPRIDEAVCSHLGIDMKEWQAENSRRKAEIVRQQQAAQQAKIQAAIKEIQQKQLEKQQEQQQLAELQQQQQALASASGSGTSLPGNFSIPPPSLFTGQDPMWQTGSGPFFPQTQFGSPFTFPAMAQQGFPPYMQGWGIGGPPDVLPQQPPPPTTPALPTPPQPAPPQTPAGILPQSFPLAATPTPPGPPAPGLPGAIVQPPLPQVPPAAPPPILPDLSKPPPSAEVMPPVPPPAPVLDMSIPLPGFGASQPSGSMSPDPPPPGTEIALNSIALPPTPKNEPSPSVSFLSPRLLAEAMIESPGSRMSKKEAKRAARMLEEQQNRKAEVKVEANVYRSLFFGKDAGEGDSVKIKEEEIQAEFEEMKLPSSSEVGVKSEAEREEDAKEGRRQYKFAWDKKEEEELSDVTISSVHTSDLSAFSDAEPSSDEEAASQKEEKSMNKDLEDVSSATESDAKQVSDESDQEKAPTTDAEVKPGTPPQVSETKPRKLIALSYNYSDSEDDETREERKARVAKEKEERYLKRQVRRAEMEVKRKEREEEKERLRQERTKAKAAAETSQSDEGTPVKDEKQHKQDEEVQESVAADTAARKLQLQTGYSSAAASSQDEGGASTPKAATTPRKKHRTKAEMKEELMQQKVEQRRAMRTRRQRTLNRRYVSDEFTSIFTENRNLAPHLGFSDPHAEEVVEQTVEVDTTVEIDGEMIIQEMEVQEECIIETETIPLPEDPMPPDLDYSVPATSDTIEISSEVAPHKSRDSGDEKRRRSSRVSSPYSDISDESHTTRSSSASSSSSSSSSSSPERERSPPRRRRRNYSDSSESDHRPVRRSSRRRYEVPEEPVRSTRSLASSSRRKGGPELTESRSRTSQHYSTDDLYKPRTSHRRPHTPPAAVETRTDWESRDLYSSDSRSYQRRSNNDQQRMPSRHGHRDVLHEPRAYATRSSTRSIDVSGRSPPVEQTERRPITPSVMADLELEPVSDDDSLDKVLYSEEQEEEAEVQSVERAEDTGSRDGHKPAISEGSKSETQEEEGEDSDRRRKKRVPIEMVDFGEAARRVRSSSGSGGGAVSSAGGAAVAPSNWSSRRSEGRGYASSQSSSITQPPPPSSLPPPQSRSTPSPYVYERNKTWTAKPTATQREPPPPREPHPTRESYSREPLPPREPHSREPLPPRESYPREPLPPREPHSREPLPPREPYPREPLPPREPHPREPLPPREPHPREPLPPREPHPREPLPPREPHPREPLPPREPHPREPHPREPLPPREPHPREPLPPREPHPREPHPESSSQYRSYEPFDRSKMNWVAPHLRSNRSSSHSFQANSEASGASQVSKSPRGSVADEGPPSPGKEEGEQAPEETGSQGSCGSPLLQRPLYSPINDSSSSLMSCSDASPARQSPSPPPSKKRRRSSSSSSGSSPPPVAPPPAPKPAKRKKEGELSEGEVSSESTVHSNDEERYRYENLPKSVRKYQTRPEKESTLYSNQASNISSDESSYSKHRKTGSSVSRVSRSQRDVSPSMHYGHRKRQRSSSSSDSRKRRRRHSKSRHHHSGSGSKRRVQRSSSPEERSERKRQLQRRRSPSPDYDVARFSPARSPSPPALGPAGSMSPISANSLSDSIPEEGEAFSPPPQLEHFGPGQSDAARGLEDSQTPPPRDPYSPLPEGDSLSPPPLPDEELPPLPPSDEEAYPPSPPPPGSSPRGEDPLAPGHRLPLRGVLPNLPSAENLLSLPREALPPLPLDLMSSPAHEPSPPSCPPEQSPPSPPQEVAGGPPVPDDKPAPPLAAEMQCSPEDKPPSPIEEPCPPMHGPSLPPPLPEEGKSAAAPSSSEFPPEESKDLPSLPGEKTDQHGGVGADAGNSSPHAEQSMRNDCEVSGDDLVSKPTPDSLALPSENSDAHPQAVSGSPSALSSGPSETMPIESAKQFASPEESVSLSTTGAQGAPSKEESNSSSALPEDSQCLSGDVSVPEQTAVSSPQVAKISEEHPLSQDPVSSDQMATSPAQGQDKSAPSPKDSFVPSLPIDRPGVTPTDREESCDAAVPGKAVSPSRPLEGSSKASPDPEDSRVISLTSENSPAPSLPSENLATPPSELEASKSPPTSGSEPMETDRKSHMQSSTSTSLQPVCSAASTVLPSSQVTASSGETISSDNKEPEMSQDSVKGEHSGTVEECLQGTSADQKSVSVVSGAQPETSSSGVEDQSKQFPEKGHSVESQQEDSGTPVSGTTEAPVSVSSNVTEASLQISPKGQPGSASDTNKVVPDVSVASSDGASNSVEVKAALSPTPQLASQRQLAPGDSKTTEEAAGPLPEDSQVSPTPSPPVLSAEEASSVPPTEQESQEAVSASTHPADSGTAAETSSASLPAPSSPQPALAESSPRGSSYPSSPQPSQAQGYAGDSPDGAHPAVSTQITGEPKSAEAMVESVVDPHTQPAEQPGQQSSSDVSVAGSSGLSQEPPRSPSSLKSADSLNPPKSPCSDKSFDSEKGSKQGRSSPHSGKSTSPKPPPSPPRRRETRSLSQTSQKDQTVVTRRRSQNSAPAPAPAQRETRRSRPPSPPPRGTRNRREKSPPAKRAKR